MKAVILAAGLGERLRPLTENTPKCLLDYNGRTFLNYHIKILNKLGIKDITIVIGYCSEKIKHATDNTLKYIYNANYRNNGTLDSLALAKQEFNEDVILINSDVLFTEKNLMRIIENNEEICLGIDTSSDQKDSTNVKISEGGISDMGFLDSGSVSGSYCGVARFSQSTGEMLKEILSDMVENKRSYIFHLIKSLIKRGKKIGYVECNKNSWCEIDTHEDMKNNLEVIGRLLEAV
ncbi:NTP transferase domain-containing protein [Elusimicrobiota bacterium]